VDGAPVTDTSDGEPRGDEDAGDGRRADASAGYCSQLGAEVGVRFCADFERTPWDLGFPHNNTYLGDFFGPATPAGAGRTGTAARVRGDIPAGAIDEIRTDAFAIPVNQALRVELSFLLSNVASQAEVLTLVGAAPDEKEITLYVVGGKLKIRAPSGDTEGLAVANDEWTRVTLDVANAGSRLTVGTKNEVDMLTSRTLLGASVTVGIGLWYKQGAGQTSYAIDDLRLLTVE